MKTALTNRLNYLHTRLAADFGGTDEQTVWLEAGAGAWTKIPVLLLASRPDQQALPGHLNLPSDKINFRVSKAAWPAVRLDAIFRLGPAAAGDPGVPNAANPKYRVTAVPSSPQIDWQRVEAERH